MTRKEINRLTRELHEKSVVAYWREIKDYNRENKKEEIRKEEMKKQSKK